MPLSFWNFAPTNCLLRWKLSPRPFDLTFFFLTRSQIKSQLFVYLRGHITSIHAVTLALDESSTYFHTSDDMQLQVKTTDRVMVPRCHSWRDRSTNNRNHFRRPSWPSSGPEFCVFWLWEMLASGWGSFWESSSFVSCLCRMRSRTSPERFRSGPELAGSEEDRQDGIASLKCGFPSYWTPEITCLLLYLQFPRKLEWCSLLVIWVIWEHLSFVPS